MKNNKGFILILTLVMALVMLIICFVCLKIFLAPYVAIQSDIIKKKEFYMADTAIEVIREQISNIFYDYVDSTEGWEKGTNKDLYYADCLKQRFTDDKKHFSDGEIIGSTVTKKYSGNIFDTENFDYTLPTSTNKLQISTANIKIWGEWHKPSTGTYSLLQETPDKNLSVKAHIEQIRITDDKIVSTTTCPSGTNDFYYEYCENSSSGTFKIGNITYYNKLFLPKELQDFNNSKLYLGHDINPESRDYIINRIRRRDFVIIATATYSGSNIECHMKYYFTLISLSPNKDDQKSFWNNGVQGAPGDADYMKITNIRPIYRLYFRKLEYDWTEED